MAVECTGRNVEVTPSLKELAEERAAAARAPPRRPGQGPRRPLAREAPIRRGDHRDHAAPPLEGAGGDGGPAGRGRPRLREDRRPGDARTPRSDATESTAAWPRFLPKGCAATAGVAAAPAGAARARVPSGAERPPAVKPMGVDEAALAMEASGQEVLVFRDASSERVSVLYKRRDGDFGLIVPEC